MPNVLLITADQWRGECLSALGHPVLRTPNIDALARRGVIFRNHFTQCMPCGPSRTSLLTGMYAMNHRSVRNGTPLDSRFTNIALEMRKLGFAPSLIGYTDTALDPRGRDRNDPALATYAGTMPGFIQMVPGSEGDDAWIADLTNKGYKLGNSRAEVCRQLANYAGAAGRGPTYPPTGFRAQDSETAFATNAAIQFVTYQKAPWFLHLSLLVPHPPFAAPEPYNKMYAAEDVPEWRAAPTPEGEVDHPYVAYMRRHFYGRDDLDPKTHLQEPVAMRQLRATYYGMMSEVDAQIGRLMAALEEAGSLGDTLIIFTSDHGEMMWDHWVLGKEFFYDKAAHIPLIVAAPGKEWDGGRGMIVDEFTGSIDVMPTVLDLLGATPPLQCDGTSLKGFLAGTRPAHWRQEIFWELDFREANSNRPEREMGIALDDCCLAVLRGPRWKYVHFAAQPPVFFDLKDDPDELRNRAKDPACASAMLAMAQKMLSLRMLKADRLMTGIKLTKNGPVECPLDRRFPVLA